jgi:hypothetical protein
MRNYILRQYTTLTPSTRILWHNGSCHTRNFFQTVIWLFLLWVLYTIGTYIVPSFIVIIQRTIWWLWVILYLHFIVEFLNKYLDSLITTPKWIVIFEREWFLHYKLQQFDRDNIESISHSQNSISDKIIGKWTIQLSIEHGIIFNFHDISSPHRIADELRNQKQQYWSHHNESFWDHTLWWDSNEKFEILVETLWEVIKDYMGKHKELPHKEKRDM